jgi:hypothetical protein
MFALPLIGASLISDARLFLLQAARARRMPMTDRWMRERSAALADEYLTKARAQEVGPTGILSEII